MYLQIDQYSREVFNCMSLLIHEEPHSIILTYSRIYNSFCHSCKDIKPIKLKKLYHNTQTGNYYIVTRKKHQNFPLSLDPELPELEPKCKELYIKKQNTFKTCVNSQYTFNKLQWINGITICWNGKRAWKLQSRLACLPEEISRLKLSTYIVKWSYISFNLQITITISNTIRKIVSTINKW